MPIFKNDDKKVVKKKRRWRAMEKVKKSNRGREINKHRKEEREIKSMINFYVRTQLFSILFLFAEGNTSLLFDIFPFLISKIVIGYQQI